MSVEYHGWVVLATSQDDWSDTDFEQSDRRVSDLLRDLSPENGHDPEMPESQILPQMVHLKGSGAESVVPVHQVLEQIGQIFDKAYGELVVFDDQGDQNRWWDFSAVNRY